MSKQIALRVFHSLPKTIQYTLRPSFGHKLVKFDIIAMQATDKINDHILILNVSEVEVRKQLMQMFCDHTLTFCENEILIQQLNNHPQLAGLDPIARIFVVGEPQIYQKRLATKLNIPLEIITPFYNPLSNHESWPTQYIPDSCLEISPEQLDEMIGSTSISEYSDWNLNLPNGILTERLESAEDPKIYFPHGETHASVEFVYLIALAIWSSNLAKRDAIFELAQEIPEHEIGGKLSRILKQIMQAKKPIDFQCAGFEFQLHYLQIITRLFIERHQYDELGKFRNGVISSIMENIDDFIAQPTSAASALAILQWSYVNCNSVDLVAFKLSGDGQTKFLSKITANHQVTQSYIQLCLSYADFDSIYDVFENFQFNNIGDERCYFRIATFVLRQKFSIKKGAPGNATSTFLSNVVSIITKRLGELSQEYRSKIETIIQLHWHVVAKIIAMVDFDPVKISSLYESALEHPDITNKDLFSEILRLKDHQYLTVLIETLRARQKVVDSEQSVLDDEILEFEIQIAELETLNVNLKELNTPQCELSFAQQMRSIYYFRAENNLAEAQGRLQDLESQEYMAPENARRVRQERIIINMHSDVSNIYELGNMPDNPNHVIVLATLNNLNTEALISPLVPILHDRGVAVTHLNFGIPGNSVRGNISSGLNEIVPGRYGENSVNKEWNIDWSKKRVECSGTNYYQGIYELMMQTFRRNTIELEDLYQLHVFRKLLAKCDCLLGILESISNYCESNKVFVTLVTPSCHIAPYSIVPKFVQNKKNKYLSHVVVSNSYEGYFGEFVTNEASTMAVSDSVLYPNRRSPFLADRKEFNQWMQLADFQSTQSRAHVEELVTRNRSAVNASVSQSELLRDLKNRRKNKQRIVCALGKIPVDIGVPYDGGPCHMGMKHWINDCVEIARQNPDIYLLIKPHPHEMRRELAGNLCEYFFDLIEAKPMPENVRFLEHNEINLHTLSAELDLALMWNGSSCVELTILGVPVVLAGHFGRFDYPIDLHYPKNREHFVSLIQGNGVVKPSEELINQAAALLIYMDSAEMSFKNDYSYRQITNDPVDGPKMKSKSFDLPIILNDPHLNAAVDRLTERFGAGG